MWWFRIWDVKYCLSNCLWVGSGWFTFQGCCPETQSDHVRSWPKSLQTSFKHSGGAGVPNLQAAGRGASQAQAAGIVIEEAFLSLKSLGCLHGHRPLRTILIMGSDVPATCKHNNTVRRTPIRASQKSTRPISRFSSSHSQSVSFGLWRDACLSRPSTSFIDQESWIEEAVGVSVLNTSVLCVQMLLIGFLAGLLKKPSTDFDQVWSIAQESKSRGGYRNFKMINLRFVWAFFHIFFKSNKSIWMESGKNVANLPLHGQSIGALWSRSRSNENKNSCFSEPEGPRFKPQVNPIYFCEKSPK